MDWREYLHGRGISDATIERYALSGGRYNNRPSIYIPTIGMEGERGYRHKFIDGNKPKIKWEGLTEQKENFRYYSPGGMKQAIADDDHTLYWLSGEPDVWTWHSVHGQINATCTFGEGSVPETVAADLQFLGVKHVIMFPDLDDAGMKAAGKLWRYLEGSGIGLVVVRLPGEIGSKLDLNQVWQDVKFDKVSFADIRYNDSASLPDTELELYAPAVKPDDQPRLDLDFGNAYHEWIDMVISSLGHYDTREGHIERWHCPLPHHEDRNPSFRVANGDRCKMPICTCGIQDKEPTDAWNEIAIARNIDTWDQYKMRMLHKSGSSKPIAPNAPSVNGHKPTEEPAPTEPLWLDSHAVFNQLADHLEGINIPDVEYVENPFTVLHPFGGFAEIMFPGKLVYIVGISGGGKTSLAENFGERFLKQGYDFAWYGPEWSPYEMGLRALQRSGGLDMINMAKGLMWQTQGKNNVPEEKRKGIKLGDNERNKSLELIYNMAAWPGRAYFLTPAANKLPLTAMLDVVRAMVTERRAAGRKVVAFFFDYLQRANRGGRDGAFWSEAVIGEIKSLCEELALIGFVMIQPKKGDGEDVRSGVDLNEASGQGISDQQCNLYLAVNPIFENGIRTDYGKIAIVKNSMGRPGEVIVPIEFERLSWIDKRTTVTHINLGSKE